jgi:hypothetical protein
MKLSLAAKIATLLTITLSTFSVNIKPSNSNTPNFAEQKVEQGNFVAVAVPYNYKQYRLAIIEQIPGQQKCWQESGSAPTTVDLTLLTFDHTNSCRRAVDTNNYTLRVNGNDDRVAYLLRLMPSNGDIFLVADHQDPNLQDLVIGRTSGIAAAPIKINFEPGWQFTKRIYDGNVLNHIYISNSTNLSDIATNSNPQLNTNTNNNTTPSSIPNNPTSQPVSNSTYPTQQPPTQPTTTVSNQPNSTPSNSTPYCNPTTPAQPTVTSAAVDTLTSILTPLTSFVFQSYNALFDQNVTVTNNTDSPQNPCP